MAFLDVSELLVDPDLADSFPVIRRSQVMNNHGRVELAAVTLPGVGVVCASTPSDLQRLPEDQRTQRAITVTTNFRLRATTPDYAPDLIGWQGDFYVVADLKPFVNFGAGMVSAVCVSMDYQDAPPPEASIDTGEIGPADSGDEGTVGPPDV